MRLGAHTNNEAISTVPRDVLHFFKFFEFIVNHLIYDKERVGIKTLGLDLPQYAHADLQRVEVLAVNAHVHPGVAVRGKRIGTLVMPIIAAKMRHRDGPALWVVLHGIG